MLNDVLDKRDVGTGHVNRVYFDKKMSLTTISILEIHKKLDAIAGGGGQRQFTNELPRGKKNKLRYELEHSKPSMRLGCSCGLLAFQVKTIHRFLE